MTAEIICVGTEILLGNIVNTNATYLSEKCAGLGLSMYYQSVVGDNQERLEKTLECALNRSQVILLSGGLGPTEDDLTKETAARFMGRTLVEDKKAREMLDMYFRKMNRPMTENNKKQALVPENSMVLYNDNGTAPGILMEDEKHVVILLPGPPGELIPLFEKWIVPYFQEKQKGMIHSVMIKLCAIGESSAETKILDLIDGQTNPTVATYAKTGEVHLRVTAKADTKEEAEKLLAPMVTEICHRFEGHVFSMDEAIQLEDAIGQLLKDRKMTVTTAESCTGGLVAGRLVNSAGISNCFKEGYIVYSNEAKEKLLGVSHKTLQSVGAVSEETAREMAIGAANAARSNAAVSITGVAGPDASETKPAGLVYIGCYCNEAVIVKKFQFYGNRNQIRERSVSAALTLLWKTLKNDGGSI